MLTPRRNKSSGLWYTLVEHLIEMKQNVVTKQNFNDALGDFVATLAPAVTTPDGQWTVKGFIDTFKSVYTISADTKVVSKILEIHLLPSILKFAELSDFAVVLAKHQNYYPDLSFVSKHDDRIRYAVDFKTTYRNDAKPWLCNGFTLGSHGKYFTERTSTKNIQYPYASYGGHFCLGVIYDRTVDADEELSGPHSIDELQSIASVISNIRFFVAEKWRIASDRRGSGNTANIGSIQHIEDICSGNGMFARLGEDWFDDYWMNFGKITVRDASGGTEKINSLEKFVRYRGGDTSLVVPRKMQP